MFYRDYIWVSDSVKTMIHHFSESARAVGNSLHPVTHIKNHMSSPHSKSKHILFSDMSGFLVVLYFGTFEHS